MVDNGRSERLPLRGVLGGFVQSTLRYAHSTSSHWRSSLVEGSHGHLEAGTLADQDILLRHHDILEGDAPGIAGPLPHVDLLPARSEAGSVAVHDEPGEGLAGGALGVGVSPRQHEVVVGHPSVGDPHLRAIDHPVAIGILDCLRLDPGDIRARTRFSDTVGTHQRLLDQTAEILLLLLVIASDHDGHGSEAISLDGSHDASAAIGHLLCDQAAIESAKTHPTVLGGDVQVHQTRLVSLPVIKISYLEFYQKAMLLEDGPGELAGAVVVGSYGDDFVGGELGGQVQELLGGGNGTNWGNEVWVNQGCTTVIRNRKTAK